MCCVQEHVAKFKVKVTVSTVGKVYAFQILVGPIRSSCMMGFKNYLAEMIIMTRQCVACKNHVARSKVKVITGTLSLCIPELCPTHNFIPKIDLA